MQGASRVTVGGCGPATSCGHRVGRASRYGRRVRSVQADIAADVAAWASSGAMALTGECDGPPRPEPAAAASAAAEAATALGTATARWGRRVDVDGPAILGERAAIAGLVRHGSVSVGGSATFVAVADGWVALNLGRPCDVDALPALVAADINAADWFTVTRELAQMPTAVVLERARLLGLAAASPPPLKRRGWRAPASETSSGMPAASVPGSSLALAPEPCPALLGKGECLGSAVGEIHRGGTRRRGARPLVIDMTSLWAGPLAGSLLVAAGARVIKVEGVNRADGARRGPRQFFDLLNAGKECFAVDFDSRQGRSLLVALIAAADLVLEGSRPRVMDRLGIDPVAVADAGISWLSINGHGRYGACAERVAFGDDAAVAGGLFVHAPRPMFAADAIADPLTGLVAAAAAADMLANATASVAEVPLARVAHWAAGPAATNQVIRSGSGWSVVVGAERVRVAEPRARPPTGQACAHGAHTESIASAGIA